MLDESTTKTFLGFDFSTQRLKAVIIDESYAVLQVADVEFDVDLPEFRTSGGVLRGQKGEVTAPPLLWVKALDMVLDRLIVAGADFSTIRALSGAGQQHGSVWWAKGSEEKLKNLSPEEFLHTQLASSFVCDSPVWMDSSTSADCRALEEAHGGPEQLAKTTGSRAYERFTGPQIRKMYRSKPRVYQAAQRISLVSSFACSLLLGRIAPVDLADGSGMNLLDIHTMRWDHKSLKQAEGIQAAARISLVSSFACSLLLGRIAPVDLADGSGMNLLDIHTMRWDHKSLKACGDESLESKLGAPVATPSDLGPISSYYVARYGFYPDCRVIAFTGDNCSALAGLHLRSGWVGLSLGTSDTLLLGLQEARAPPAGHILVGPTSEAPYMALLCFSNGSLTRQNHRDRLAEEKSWEAFNDLLRGTVRGNMGYMGIYYDTPEIVPRIKPGRWLWDVNGRPLEKTAPQFEARALLEGQAIARRVHAEDMGFTLDKSSRIVATGGASVNKDLLQIFADVFNIPVYVQEAHANAALLGSAIRAAEVWAQSAGAKLQGSALAVAPVATPNADAEQIYKPMLDRYRKLVQTLPALE